MKTKKTVKTTMKTTNMFDRWHHQRQLLFVIITCASVADYWPTVESLKLDQCSASLGMQSGEIPDSSLTASSSSDPITYGPQNSRIRLEHGGGAWCPGQRVSNGVYEYLQVKLAELKVISFVETQGRFGNGQGQEFTDQYFIEYQRQDNGPWFRFRDRRGEQLFHGNTNTHISEMRELDPPTIAKSVRFVPFSVHPRTVCLRVELYGCPWNDGLISYSMPQGERRGNEVDLYDFTYDGNSTSDHRLYGGLGQLSDGEEGQSNFRLDPLGRNIRGYEWIGWKNESFSVDRPLEILFRFNAVRNFTSMQLHANNMFHRDVRVFSRATVSVVDETNVDDDELHNDSQTNVKSSLRRTSSASARESLVIVYTYNRDLVSEAARTVTVPLSNLVCRTLVVQLGFDAKWLMLSEVHFESTTVDDVEPTTATSVVVTTTSRPMKSVPGLAADGATHFQSRLPVFQNTIDHATTNSNINFTHKKTGNGRRDYAPPGERDESKLLGGINGQSSSRDNDDVTALNQTVSTKTLYGGGRLSRHVLIGLLVGVFVPFLLVLVTVTSLVLIWRRRKYACKDLCKTQRYRNQQNKIKTTVIQPEMGGFSLALAHDIGLPSSPLSTCRVGDVSVTTRQPAFSMLGDCASESREHNNRQRHQLIVTSSPSSAGITNIGAAPVDENTYYSVSDNALTEHLLPVSQRGDDRSSPLITSSFSATLRSVAMTATRRSRDVIGFDAGHGTGRFRSRDYTGERSPGNYPGAVNDLTTIARDTGTKWNQTSGLEPREIPRQQLKFVEKLGMGKFGEISLASWQHGGQPAIYATIDHKANSDHCLVAMATLSNSTNRSAVAEFGRHLAVMAQLCDVNIASLVGVCSISEPQCLVFEYTTSGDLASYLRSSASRISHGCLVYMTSQIASGMRYLESLGVVHGDLAARNCLINEDRLVVKISNFGLGRALYPLDYTDDELLPVSVPLRWMAWEAVLLNHCSTRSDVWSFAVTMWEVLGRALRQPFDWLTDEQVLDNCRRHGCHNDNDDGHVIPAPCTLPMPSDECPRELYDMMRQCWVSDSNYRPTFAEIQMFLVRKNDGYRPSLPSCGISLLD